MKKAAGIKNPDGFSSCDVSPDYLRKDIFLVSAKVPLARR